MQTKGWKLGIIFMNVWTEEEDNFLRNNYKDMTYQEISEKISRTKSAIQARIRKLGLNKGYHSFKNELNSNYFETIDDEHKAYWLGFICADGCVSYSKNSQTYCFKISLQLRDVEFLKMFIDDIDGKFEPKIKKAKIKSENSCKYYDICEVSFKDKKFTSDLLQYFSTNKTEYLRIPNQVPNHLIRHFIRGFSDGDGCFYCNLKKEINLMK